MGASKRERLAEFLHRLQAAPPAASAEEALDLVNRTLNEVEDELSGIPRVPDAATRLHTGGRMYGPDPAFASSWKERSDLVRYAHTEHDTLVQANGAFLIRLRRPPRVLRSRPGADGQEVEL